MSSIKFSLDALKERERLKDHFLFSVVGKNQNTWNFYFEYFSYSYNIKVNLSEIKEKFEETYICVKTG